MDEGRGRLPAVEWDGVWGALDEPWRRAFGLAWEAFVEGSIAVGAVALGPDGDVVVEGRNRSADDDPPTGQLGGSYIAHAEVNALGRLPLATAEPITLLTTLEPCALCRAACRYAHVAEVRSAAADPLWEGMERMGELNAFFARRWPSFVAVDLGPLSTWSGALALTAIVHRVARRRSAAWETVLADDLVVAGNRQGQPTYVALAEALLADGLTPASGAEISLEQALARWWPSIEAAGTPASGAPR